MQKQKVAKSVQALIDGAKGPRIGKFQMMSIVSCALVVFLFSLGWPDLFKELLNNEPFLGLLLLLCLVLVLVICILPQIFLKNWCPKDEKLRSLVEERVKKIDHQIDELKNEKSELVAFLAAKNWQDAGLGKNDLIEVPDDEESETFKN